MLWIFLSIIALGQNEEWYKLPSSSDGGAVNVYPLEEIKSEEIRIGIIDGDISYEDILAFKIGGYEKHIFDSPPEKDDHAQQVVASFLEEIPKHKNVKVYHCVMSSHFSVYGCLTWLIKNQVRAINISQGFMAVSNLSHEKFKFLESQKIPIIVSAGNESTEAAGFCVMYKNVYCIGALDSSGNKAPYSNYGPYVYSWDLGLSPVGKEGTSFSAPRFLGKLIK